MQQIVILHSMMLMTVFKQFFFLSWCDTEGRFLLNRKISQICLLATSITYTTCELQRVKVLTQHVVRRDTWILTNDSPPWG